MQPQEKIVVISVGTYPSITRSFKEAGLVCLESLSHSQMTAPHILDLEYKQVKQSNPPKKQKTYIPYNPKRRK